MLSILKKEISIYLSSLAAYVAVAGFLLVAGLFLWVFPDSGILEYGYAGMENFFGIAPYLFMFFVPALAMRLLAEEQKEGTFELLLTKPVTIMQIIMGKYAACLLLVLFALLPTLVYYYSIYSLGNPVGNIDTGGVVGSYIGLFLLGGVFVAIGLFASALSKNQGVAFTIAVFLCYFFYDGFGALSSISAWQNLNLYNWGIAEHYQSASRGVLDTRDLIYFLSLSAAFILLVQIVLLKRGQHKVLWLKVALILFVLLGVGFVVSLNWGRIDFTKEKRYTLSPISKAILGNLRDDVYISVYLQGNNFPGGFKRLQQATKDILADMQAYGGRKLHVEFIDPLAGQTDADKEQTIQELQARGIEPNSLSVKTDDGLSQQIIFPAAMVSAKQHAIPVKLLQTRIGLSPEEVLNNSIQNLEYAFTSAIKKAASKGLLSIGFTEGNGELKTDRLSGALHALSDGYITGRVNLNLMPFDSLKAISLLVVAKPSRAFTEAEKFKIDQYIMQGGRVLWCIDQVNAELDSLRGRGGDQLAFPKQLNIDDQLFKYGVRINYDLLADMSCSQIPVAAGNIAGQSQIQMAPWLFYPVFIPQSANPIVKNMDGIRGQFVSTIDTLGVKNIRKMVLLSSSPYNKKFATPYMLSLQTLEQEPEPANFQGEPQITGVLLEGRFHSGFANRPVPAGVTEHIAPAAESKPTKMVVFSDGDIFKNEVATDGSPYPLGYDHYTRQSFGNKNLLLNVADYLTDDSGLIGLRSKEVKLRLLDRASVRSEKVFWQIFNMVVPLLIVLTFAIFQHYVRRLKYTR